MRFSRLVQLKQVCRTLTEAAAYLQGGGTPELCRELIQSGTELLDKMDALLTQVQSDWKSTRPMELLRRVQSAWRDPLPDDMAERLSALDRSLREDIAVQVRAVFFAELGGKWDSMDSVYRYMCSDPRFDPVVVLTPIFRAVQKDGETKTEVIYEDYLTGMGIPFLDYREYAPEQDCPELAFTSQPYESVTLPEFWAQNIAQYTNLVYLSYYVPVFVYTGNKDILCNMPMHQYAWRVAASSEKFACCYRMYHRQHGANLMVTGLPKMDYAVSLKKGVCEIPESWKSKLEGRTAILWNTWYDWERTSLDLLEQMLPWFEEHRELALIWRPHPMSEAVTKLYVPERYETLKKMLKKVAASDHMVLDTGAECGPAFVCSSAMISDYSAMMSQYMLLNKPVLWIQREGRTPISRQIEKSGQWVVSNRWMERAADKDGVLAFIEHITHGEDEKRAVREAICAEDLPLADGNAAERICNSLWTDLFQEYLGE